MPKQKRRITVDAAQQWMRPRQLAEALDVSVQTVYGWAHAGLVPSKRIGRTLRVSMPLDAGQKGGK